MFKGMRRELLYLTFGFVLFFSSCSEFIEPSLEHKVISSIAPADGVETNSYQLTFWWEGHEDALTYRLQVVSPTFNATEKLLLDTLVKNDKFIYTLDPGNYQWRVRAENGSSHTAFVTKGFTIHSSSLTDQALQLSSPTGQVYTNNAAVAAQWLKLYGATGYRLQIDRNNFSDENNLVLNIFTDNLSYNYILPQEGNYQLRVRGENATENSKWSSVRNISYDATPPAQVVLSTPINGQAITKPFSLSWTSVTGAVQYELGLYKNDMVTPYSGAFPQLLANNSFPLTVGNVGETLAWRVRAIDRVGNKGAWSGFFTFTIQ